MDSGNTVQLKDKNVQLVTLVEGDSKVVMKSGKILLKGRTSGGDRDTIELDALKDLLPQFQTNGEHKFLASQTGQPVDIDEKTTNTTDRSSERDGWEGCSITVTRPAPCPTTPPPANGGGDKPGQGGNNGGGGNKGGGNGGGGHGKPGNGGGGQHGAVASFTARRPASGEGCTAEVVIQGHRHIRYHYEGDGFEIQLIMTNPGTGIKVAAFDGTSYSSNEVVDYRADRCITNEDEGGDHGPGRGGR